MPLTSNANQVPARLSDWDNVPSGVWEPRRDRSIGPAIKRVLEMVIPLLIVALIMVGMMALDLAIWTPVLHR